MSARRLARLGGYSQPIGCTPWHGYVAGPRTYCLAGGAIHPRILAFTKTRRFGRRAFSVTVDRLKSRFPAGVATTQARRLDGKGGRNDRKALYAGD
jgi:hypothetical protein